MSENERPDPDGTDTIDLGDADVSAVDPESQRSLPPPLPAEIRASAAPATPMTELSAPPSPPPAAAYASVAPPPPRSNRFYVMLLAAFLVLGIIAGIVIALGTRAERKPVSVTAPTGSVLTLPTIDMNDDEGDGGK